MAVGAPRQAQGMQRILIVDDERVIRETLAEFLTQEGYTVETAADAERALELARVRHFDLALCDIQLPGLDGVELMARLLQLSQDTFVVLITAYGTVETAVEAFKRGANDYLLKPLLFDEVLVKIRHLFRFRQLHLENQWLRCELNQAEAGERMIGKSPVMQQLLEMAARVAQARSSVLLVGESGTGKELLARAIHHNGPMGHERFIPVNCAALPAEQLEMHLFGYQRGAFPGADQDRHGIFVAAGAGTIFLDEVAELSVATQAKLLRTIEQKEIFPIGAAEPIQVECRILAATNKDLEKLCETGAFRHELFYRLNVVRLTLPTLRERREDIPELVSHLLARHSRTLGKRFAGVSHEAMKLLLSAPWRGNVRELDNALQRAVILGNGPLLQPSDLPPGLAPSPEVCLEDDLREAVAHFECRHIERILRETPDKKEAARRLGLALSSLYRKIEELKIAIPGEERK